MYKEIMKLVSVISNVFLTGLATYMAVKIGDPISYAMAVSWFLATICSCIMMR